jgi:hypothetical protein
MVQNTGKTLRHDAIKPVNLPEPVRVEENPDGTPAALKTKRRLKIGSIEDRWRIDDEWWRLEPISRFYYAIMLASGLRMVLYKDLIKNEWYRQSL